MPDLPTITEQQHTTRAVAAGYVIGRSDTSAFGWGWSQYRIFVRAFDLGKCELFLRGYSGMSRVNADVSMVWRDGWRGRQIGPSIGPPIVLQWTSVEAFSGYGWLQAWLRARTHGRPRARMCGWLRVWFRCRCLYQPFQGFAGSRGWLLVSRGTVAESVFA